MFILFIHAPQCLTNLQQLSGGNVFKVHVAIVVSYRCLCASERGKDCSSSLCWLRHAGYDW